MKVKVLSLAISVLVLTACGGSDNKKAASEAQSEFEVNPTITVNGTEDSPLTVTINANKVPDGAGNVIYELLSQPTLGEISGDYPNLSYLPTADQFGDDTFRFKLKKGNKESATVIANITLVAVNDAPTITGTANETIRANDTYYFAASAGDIDSEQLSFNIVNKPDWAMFDVSSGILRGVPSNEHVGKAKDIVISVSDGELTTALPAFDIEVIAEPWVKRGDLPGFEGSHLNALSTGDSLYALTHHFAIASSMSCAGAEPSPPKFSHWNITQNEWQQLSSPQSNRYYYQSELVGNKLFLFGGTEQCSSGSNGQENMEVYDTKEQVWHTFTAPTFTPFGNQLQASCSFNNEVIVFSKNGQRTQLNRLNTVDNSWHTTDLPENFNEVQHCFNKGDGLYVIQRQGADLLLGQLDLAATNIINAELIPNFTADAYYDLAIVGSKLHLLSAKEFLEFDFEQMQWRNLPINPFAKEVQDTQTFYLRDFKAVSYANGLLSVGGVYTSHYGTAIYQYTSL